MPDSLAFTAGGNWLATPAAGWQNALMKTVVLQEPGKLLVTETEPPAEAAEGEALVRVHRVVISGTEQHAKRASQPVLE